MLLAVILLALATSGSSSGGRASSPVAITTGYLHTCALLDGGVQCWGDDAAGQLGVESAYPYQRARPVTVPGLSGAQAVSAGSFHSCALSGGAIWCWGANDDGQLGDGTKTDRTKPLAVSGLAGVQAIAAGGDHTCALLGGGVVECWGDNGYGQLGDGTETDRRRPVAVSGLPSGVQMIAAGGHHTCALLSGGAVDCWGRNKYGQLGDGTKTGRSRPVPVTGLPGPVQAIAAGANHTCALSGGQVWCWGENDDGELADGTKTHRSSPVAATGLPSSVQSVAAGSDAYHTCAILADGGAECWGDNDHGQLGDGTTVNRSSAVTFDGLTNGVAAIAAGDFHTCALLTADGFKCLGRNNAGQLGNGTFDRVLTVQVRGHGIVTAPGFRCSKECELERLNRTKIVLTAHPAKGWSFRFWLYQRSFGACKGPKPRCVVRLDGNYYATARFVKRRRPR